VTLLSLFLAAAAVSAPARPADARIVIDAVQVEGQIDTRLYGQFRLVTIRLLAQGLGRFPLHLVAEDRAPVPVLGEGHAALDADPDPLLGWFLLSSEQPLQQ
jgi:hypothetical protein